MKVVLFCGGEGLRLRSHPSGAPKPMVPVGPYPVLVHSMRYYARQGHRSFVLCLGYRADVIADYFEAHPPLAEIDDYDVACVDTGLGTPIGTRLLRVRDHLAGEGVFLANYGDVVCDEPAAAAVETVTGHPDVSVSMLLARPRYTFHLVTDRNGTVTGIDDVTRSDLWVNGGFFVMREDVFDVLHEGDDLVGGAFDRLIGCGRVHGRHHEGFWAPMDTLKDHEELERRWHRGDVPWWV